MFVDKGHSDFGISILFCNFRTSMFVHKKVRKVLEHTPGPIRTRMGLGINLR